MASPVLASPAVERVRAALARAGLAPDIVELPGAARTARAAAEFLGCEVAQIANSLVFRAVESGRGVLIMSSGARRVDTGKLAALVGEPIVKADADFVRTATGFAIGGVAPVGHLGELLRFVEGSLAAYAVIWAAAGHPNTVFRLTFDELLRVTAGRVADVAVPPS
ncbi:MAG TPA: YbaK/EbsC family protein [Usitatibacter sp.]|nr:YbaK/EbsC family protein [Usitatibacter sp.]